MPEELKIMKNVTLKSYLSFGIICLSLLFCLSNVPYSLLARASLNMNDYTAEMIRNEYQLLLKTLGNKDGIGGPNAKNRTQILKTKAWGVSAVEKTVWNGDGIIVSYDIYGMKNEQLIWEHEEPNKSPAVHFKITVAVGGALIRDDLTKVAPIPTKKPTQVPDEVTPVPTSMPVPTPVAVVKTPVAVEPTAPPAPTEVPYIPTEVPPTPTEVPPTPTVVPPTPTVAPPTPTVAPPVPTQVPSKDKVVFVSNKDGNLNIYSMNLDGSELKRLTSTSSDEAYPTVSSDGRKLAFASNRDGNWEIYVMDLDGKEESSVRLTFNNSDDLYPAFTSDSKKVLFQSNRDGNFELYLVDIANPRIQERLTINEFDDVHPSMYNSK